MVGRGSLRGKSGGEDDVAALTALDGRHNCLTALGREGGPTSIEFGSFFVFFIKKKTLKLIYRFSYCLNQC